MTINDIVAMIGTKFNPARDRLFVSINNPVTRGVKTPGDTVVESFEVGLEYMTDGTTDVHVYVNIMESEV